MGLDQIEEVILGKVFGAKRHAVCQCLAAKTYAHIHQHTAWQRSVRCVRVDLPEARGWQELHFERDLLQSIDHLIHQERDPAAVGEDSELHNGEEVFGAVFGVDLVVASLAGV